MFARKQASPAVLQRSGDPVVVSWKCVASLASTSWLAVYYPAENMTTTNFHGFFNVSKSQFTAGNVTLHLPYVRAEWGFALFYGYHDPVPVGISNFVVHANPEEITQLHLALTSVPSEMSLSFTSADASSGGGSNFLYFEYFPSSNPAQTQRVVPQYTSYAVTDMCAFPANSSLYFRDPGLLWVGVMTGLNYSTNYSYIIYNGNWTSAQHWFISTPHPNDTVSIINFGDMGVSVEFDFYFADQQLASAATMYWMRQQLAGEQGPVLIQHIGDLAYARGHAFLWEYFMSFIEPVSSQYPYMVTIGNHEYDHPGQPWSPTWWPGNKMDSGGECGVPYNSRFAMPETPLNAGYANYFYSYNWGPVHVVAMSTETDFTPGSPQLAFLTNDLANVDRVATPWVLFQGHRPMYSSATYMPSDPLRNHLQTILEPILLKYDVDVVTWGHVHSYERTCSVSNYNCTEGTDTKGIPHITVGMAGNIYQVPWQASATLNNNWGGQNYRPGFTWSAFNSDNYGYGRFRVSRTQLVFEFVADSDGNVHDTLVLTK